MHPLRKHVLWRWLIMAFIIVSMLLWLFWLSPPMQPRAAESTDMSPPDIDIPGGDIPSILNRGIKILANPPRLDSAGSLNFSFLPQAQTLKSSREIEPLTLGLVFTGQREKFALIDGHIYAQGQILPSGEEVLTISSKGVLISSDDGQRWLPWVHTGTVSLKREVLESSDASLTEESEDSESSREVEQFEQIINPDQKGTP